MTPRKDCPIGLRAGGWFVMDESRRGWSGPWATREAAELARDERYEEAWAAHRKGATK